MTASAGTVSAAAYCRCGNSCKVEGDGNSNVEDVLALFWSMHAGEGHGGTDAVTCRRERRRKAGEELRP